MELICFWQLGDCKRCVDLPCAAGSCRDSVMHQFFKKRWQLTAPLNLLHSLLETSATFSCRLISSRIAASDLRMTHFSGVLITQNFVSSITVTACILPIPGSYPYWPVLTWFTMLADATFFFSSVPTHYPETSGTNLWFATFKHCVF